MSGRTRLYIREDTITAGRTLVCLIPGKLSITTSPGSRFTSILFMRILAVRKREGGQILEILFRPAIAVVYCFFIGNHFVEDHDSQMQTFLRWEFLDASVVEVFCREFHRVQPNRKRTRITKSLL